MSRLHVPLLLFAVLALGAPRLEAAEQHGKYTENARWGYKIRAPKNWERRVVPLDEPWIADKFFPDYSMRDRSPTGEFVSFQPNLWVIGFPHARIERGGVHEEKVDEHTTIFRFESPYKDYKDFVQRESWASTGQGGWYFSKEEETEQGGYKVTVYEIKVEKLVSAPMRVVTWVYHCADVDFAVQVRVLENAYEENQNVIEGVMKSFREIERTEPFPEPERPEIKIPGTEPEVTRTLEEINAERLRAVTLRINREIKNLPKGWDVMQSKHFVCLTQIDKQHTRYVLNFAEEIRDYLEDNFKDLGEAEVPPGLIRVFKSQQDESAYDQGTRGWWTAEVGEITMTYGRDSAAGILSEFSWLAERLTDQYFFVKNENLKNGMPGWIRYGIWGHISWARPSKRKKLILQPTPSNIIALRQLFAQGGELPLKQLMTTSTSDYGSYGPMAEAANVVYYLLGRGNKGKVKGALLVYLKSLDQIIREEDEKFEKEQEKRWKEAQAAKANEDDSGKSDEEREREEEERFRQRRQQRDEYSEQLKGKYEAIRQRALEAAFGHLDDDDWDSLTSRWKKSVLQ